jgi:fructose-1,6-bisphosphatase I
MEDYEPGEHEPSRIGLTLETYILEGMLGRPEARGYFTSLLNQIALAAKLVTARVRRAGLANVLGTTGEQNATGDVVQKLDEEANETLMRALGRRHHCAAAASEEEEDIRILSTADSANYLVYRKDHEGPATTADFLKPGRELQAAGYVIYGSSTQFVITTGKAVHGFTYDPSVGEFLLSHENIRIPEHHPTYSINEGNAARWTEGVKRWGEWVKAEDKATRRPYSMRYVGTLVADAHRTLLRGGVFAYPADTKSPEGKLRLLYEANPFAFILEAAGGVATTGTERILDIQPTELHQKVPLVLGSRRNVEEFLRFANG